MDIARAFISGLVATVVTCTFALSGPALAETVFVDHTFNPANYSNGFLYQGPGVTTSIDFTTRTTNGSLGFIVNFNGSAASNTPGVLVGELNNTFTYNPSAQGAISFISASSLKDFDIYNDGADTLDYSNNFRPLIEQDGKFFAAAIPGTPLIVPGNSFGTTGPELLANAHLDASDFVLLDPGTGNVASGNPNFAGDPITFGIAQLLGQPGQPASINTSYSDLTIGVNSVTAAVPEPSTWAMMLFGFGGLSLLAYRKTRKGGAMPMMAA